MPYFICLIILTISQLSWAVTPSLPQDSSIPVPPNMVLEPAPQEEEPIMWGTISYRETMPRFPGCEDLEGTDWEKKECADQLLLKYIYGNINYPKEAREKGLEGMVVVSFVINEQGRLEQFELLRNPGLGIGEEALRIVESMNELAPWTPGIQRGKVVKVRYNIPIRFKLN